MRHLFAAALAPAPAVDRQSGLAVSRADTLVQSYRLSRNLTGLNFGQATFVLARSMIDEQSPVTVVNA